MTSGWTFYEIITHWDCEDETFHDKNNMQAFCVVSRFKGSGREYIMKPATLIFPHQLFRQHPGLSKEREIFLVEEQLFFSGVRSLLKFHKKKLMLHRASMQAYKKKLESQGYRVHYIDFKEDLFQSLQQKKIEEIWFSDPENPRMKVMINQIGRMGGEQMKQHLAISNSFLGQL